MDPGINPPPNQLHTYSNKMPEQKSHSNVYTNVTQHIIQKYLRFFYKIYKEICGGDEKNYKENLNKLVEADNKQTVIYSGDENCSGSNYTGSYVGSPAVGSLGDNLESGGRVQEQGGGGTPTVVPLVVPRVLIFFEKNTLFRFVFDQFWRFYRINGKILTFYDQFS